MIRQDLAAQVVENLIKTIQNGLTHYSPHALNMAITVCSFDCISNLFGGLAGIFISLLAICLSHFFKKKLAESDSDFDFFGDVAIIVSVVMLGFSTAQFFDFWSWVGAFNPKLYLAHEIMSKALS